MAKRTALDIVQNIKKREQATERTNYTFRLTKGLMEGFKKRCEKDGVSMANVIEELLKGFVNN